MEKYINDIGKEYFKGATEETPFNPDDFHEVKGFNIGGDTQFALHTDIGSLTVVDRLTGYGHGVIDVRDVETGYRDTNGKFWLASCGHDVRDSGAKTLGEAIHWVKIHANTCVGV